MISQQRLITPVLVAALLCIVSLSHAAQEVRFSWAMLIDTENGLSALDFSSPPEVDESNTLQLYLQSDNNTYIYVFLLDSSNFFSPVFPGTKNHYDKYPPGGPLHIPEGQDRFTTLPPAGQEKFYILASPERLTTVEKLLGKCLDNPKDIDKQAELFQEVRTLRRQHSKMTQFTEVGMPVSGTMRSAKKQASFVATQVVADGFYSRILRLNHE